VEIFLMYLNYPTTLAQNRRFLFSETCWWQQVHSRQK